MKSLTRSVYSAALGLIALPLLAADGPYHLLKEIPVGGEGGWDYLSVDSRSRKLYVSHATKIIVIDLDSERVAGVIDDTPGVHGIAVARELGRGFSSNGRENKVSVVDLKAFKTLAKVETGACCVSVVALRQRPDRRRCEFHFHSPGPRIF